MASTNDPTCRQVYLLSLWRETPDSPWRAALRLSGSQERMGFADLEALALFLLHLEDRESTIVLANRAGEERA
jgi:hypothetical protein